jgi:NAD(P)H dehydrogenase (quinone)
VVTGSTGHVGAEAARILAEAGLPQRLIVRDAARAPRLPRAEVITADYADRSSLLAALSRGDRVFMVSVYADHDERVSQHRNFIEAARDAEVGSVIYLSFVNASPDATFLHAVSHWETEQMLRDSGLPFTFLRTSLYQSATAKFFADQLCQAPAGDGKVSWVSRRDVGAAVAAILRQDGHDGKTYDLTGPEAISMSETADRISKLSGSVRSYADADDEASLPVSDLADIEAMRPSRRSCFLAIAAGQMGPVSGSVRSIAGIEASALDRHIALYVDRYRLTT